MKKWLFVGLAVLIVFVMSIFVYLIHDTVSASRTVHNEFIKAGLSKTPIVQITNAEHYYGTEPLIILFGLDERDEELVVWMKEDLSFIRHAWLKNGVSQDQIAATVVSNYDVRKEIHIVPGIENDIYIWEAIYLTTSGEYLYTYYDFFSGDLLRSIKLKRHLNN